MVRVRTLPFWSPMVFPSYSTWPSRATCGTLTRRRCTWTTWSSTPRSPTPPEWPWPGESWTPSCQQHTSTPRRSGQYWDFMSFRALEDWSCRKKNLQRKFEVICAETAPFEDIFFVFSELIISKFTSYKTKFPPDIISHNVQAAAPAGDGRRLLRAGEVPGGGGGAAGRLQHPRHPGEWGG